MVHRMIAGIGTQLRKGVAEFCVLGELAREPMYGWQLASKLGDRGLVAGIGTLYPMLARLRADGLVQSYVAPSNEGPARKYYELTAAGAARIEEFRREWAPFVDAVNEAIGGPHA